MLIAVDPIRESPPHRCAPLGEEERRPGPLFRACCGVGNSSWLCEYRPPLVIGCQCYIRHFRETPESNYPQGRAEKIGQTSVAWWALAWGTTEWRRKPTKPTKKHQTTLRFSNEKGLTCPRSAAVYTD